MASNDWFGKMKKRAQTLQETAKTKLEKLSETVDKKIKEVQENPEKQRTETESEPAPTLRVWRPSPDNPDGEIVTQIKSIPPPSAPSTEQKEASVPPAILAEPEPTLPVTLTAEIQQATPPPAAPVEEIFVVSRKSKGKKRSTKHTDNQAETTNTNNDEDKETVDQGPENKRTSDQTNTISTIPEISEDAPVKPTLTQEASSQPETSANQENTQQVISNDTLAANVDDENKPIEQSNQENTPVNELNTETVETDQNQLLSTENLQSTDAVTTVPITSTNDVQNAEVENSVSEDVHNSTDEPKAETTSNETSLDEPSTSTHDNQLSIESTNAENTDKETAVTEISTVTTNDRVPLEDSISVNEPTTSTNTDKFVEEHPVQEDAEKELSHDNYTQKNISTDEPISTTNTEQLIEKYPTSEDIQNNVSKEELTSTSNDNLIPDNILVDEPITLRNTDKFIEEHPVQEDAEKELSHDNYTHKNISTDEPISTTNTEQSIEKYPTSEDIQNNVSKEELLTSTSNDNLIPDNTLVDEPITLTDIEQLVKEHSVQEDTQKESSYDDHAQENISIDEPTLSTNTEELIEEYPTLEDQQNNVSKEELTSTSNDNLIPDNILVDEPITLTNTDKFIEEHPVQEDAEKELSHDNYTQKNISTNEPISTTNTEQLIEKYPTSEDIQNNVSKEELTSTSNDNLIPDNILVDEPITLTDIEQLFKEHSVQEDTQKESSYDDHAQKNISIDEPTLSTNAEELIEEYPTLKDQQNDVSNDDHILMDDEPITSTRADQLTEEQLVPEDIHKELSYDNQIRENVSVVERSTLTNTDQLADEYPVSEDTQKDVPNEELTNTTDDSFISENLPIDEPLISTNTEQSTEEQRILEADLTSEITVDDKSVAEQPVSENAYKETQHDELTTETIDNRSSEENVQDDSFVPEETFIIQLKDESQVEQHVTENVNKVPSDDDDAVPVEITTPENIQVNEPVDELSIDNADLSSVNSQPENISPDTLNDDFVFSTKTDEIPVDNFETKYIQIKTHDDLVSTDTQSDVENIPTDVPNDESSNKINPFDIEPESETDEDLSTIALVNKSSDESNTPTSNLLSNVSEDTVELPVVSSKPESITNIVPVESKSENLPTPEPDVIVSPIESAPAVKEEVKKSVEKPKAKKFLFDDSASDDEPKVITNTAITVVPLFSSSAEEVSHVLSTPPVPTATDEINPFGEVDESIETNPFGDVDEPTDQTNPFEEDEDDTNPFNEVEQSASTNPFDDDTNTTSSTTTRIVQPRYSVINYHPIPPRTKISQMNCSSLYIYFCTIDHKLFFAELNFSDPSQPFDWQQHSDLAERLVVSVSNRTVWRFFNNCIYIANDPINYLPFGSHWNTIKIDDDQSLLSMSVSDKCGWYIKEDGTLWFLRTDDKTFQSTNVPCSYTLDIVFCFSEKVGVTTNIGEILIRVGCRSNFPEGDGWLFIQKRVGFIDDFILLTNNDIMMIMDKKHRLWMNEWSTKTDFHEILLGDDFDTKKKRYLLGVNTESLYITDCEKGIYVYSNAITGVQWNVVENSSPYLRLFAAFSSEDYVWAITSSRLIGSSNGQILDKPDAVDALTHASFVPNTSSKKSILWALDQSCGIYVRSNIEKDTIWEQADDSQFEKKRKLLNIVCNNSGVWAVDDRGNIHFRHGHISANQRSQSKESSLLPPAWITVPGDAKRFRSFVQVFCGPADWMVYATDTKQNVYTRIGISATDRVGTAWKLIEDCSALELAISEHSLWLLTSHGHIECRENISLENLIGTRSVTLSGHFRSLTVSLDDSQVWALDSNRNLLKLDRLTVLFKK